MKKIINVPETMSKDMTVLSEQFGFANDTEFIRSAIREKIIELKKLLFMQVSAQVSKGLKSKSITEADVLENFQKWRKKQSA